ncbi:hypothetical protein HDE_08319 [Halotydeus destructor]|nr:hypothetical protein HDE_08319 [Halotydeus destructor]
MFYLLLSLCALSSVLGASRASNDARRFEVYDRFDRTMVESRPMSISRVGFDGTPVDRDDYNYAAPPPPAYGGQQGYGNQPEPSNLVSGLLVTRMASDMARLSQHAMRSKETRIPVYVAISEQEDDGLPSRKSIPRLLHLMDASSSRNKDPSIMAAELGSQEDIEEQVPQFFEKNVRYIEAEKYPTKYEEKSAPSPPSSSSSSSAPPSYPPPSSASPTQAAAVASTSSSSVKMQDVEMMEKIQALLEKQQEQLFRQHIESMVKEQLHQMVKSQLDLMTKEKEDKSQEYAASSSSSSSSSSSPSAAIAAGIAAANAAQAAADKAATGPAGGPATPSSLGYPAPYDPRLQFDSHVKNYMDKVAAASSRIEVGDKPKNEPRSDDIESDMGRHVELLSSLVKQHMSTLVKGQEAQAAAKAAEAVQPTTETSSEQLAKEDADRMWQRRLFYDEEQGDIRRMVPPTDSELNYQRAYLNNFKQSLLRKPRSVLFPEGPNEETVPVFIRATDHGQQILMPLYD